MKKRVVVALLSLMLAELAFANTCSETAEKQRTPGHLYLKLNTGASFARKAKISAPPASWDPSPQGYNGRLKTRPIIGAGIGCDFNSLFSADITASFRPDYRYRKFQTSTSISTPAFVGTKIRKFDLDATSLMGSLYLSGRGMSFLSWDITSSSELYPFFGGGIGASRLKIYNFRSTNLTSLIPPFPAFASENQYTIRYCFTYQLQTGLEYRYHEKWALSTGYRWFDSMRFKGPRYFRDSIGQSFDVGKDEWRIKFRAHELFLELKIFL